MPGGNPPARGALNPTTVSGIRRRTRTLVIILRQYGLFGIPTMLSQQCLRNKFCPLAPVQVVSIRRCTEYRVQCKYMLVCRKHYVSCTPTKFFLSHPRALNFDYYIIYVITTCTALVRVASDCHGRTARNRVQQQQMDNVMAHPTLYTGCHDKRMMFFILYLHCLPVMQDLGFFYLI